MFHSVPTHSGSVILVVLIKLSTLRFQLAQSPLTMPEMKTKPSTNTLTPVKIFPTRADSLTPNDSRAGWVYEYNFVKSNHTSDNLYL